MLLAVYNILHLDRNVAKTFLNQLASYIVAIKFITWYLRILSSKRQRLKDLTTLSASDEHIQLCSQILINVLLHQYRSGYNYPSSCIGKARVHNFLLEFFHQHIAIPYSFVQIFDRYNFQSFMVNWPSPKFHPQNHIGKIQFNLHQLGSRIASYTWMDGYV